MNDDGDIRWTSFQSKKKKNLSFHHHENSSGKLRIIFPILRNRFTRTMSRGDTVRERLDPTTIPKVELWEETGSSSDEEGIGANTEEEWVVLIRVGCWWWCSRGNYGGPPSLCRCIRKRPFSLRSRRVPWFSNRRNCRYQTPRRWRRPRISNSLNSSKICKISEAGSSRSHKSWKKWSRYTGVDATNDLHTDHISMN